jgi:peptide/nickel transport system substrate-binding protein
MSRSRSHARTLRASTRLGALVMGLALVLAACGGDDGDTDSDADTGDDADVSEDDEEAADDGAESEDDSADGGEQVTDLIVAMPVELDNLDIRNVGNAPRFSALRHISEPLVQFDSATGELIPALAESWERIDDTTIRLKLREGVNYHNGVPFNAETAAWSIEQALFDPDFAGWMRYATDGVIADVEVVSEYEIDLISNGLKPDMLMPMTFVDMVEPEHVQAGDQILAPVGTGPFVFESFTPSDSLVMARNDEWWGEAPAFESITWRIIPEPGTQLTALETGEIHVVSTVALDSLESVDSSPNTKVISGQSSFLHFIALRSDRGPAADKEFREALNYAVDQQLIIDTILNGSASPIVTPVWAGLENAQDFGPWPYDPDRARELLEEVGYDGEPFNLTVGTGSIPASDQIGLAVAGMLEEVGITVNYLETEFASMQEELSKGEDHAYDGWLQGWSASLPITDAQMQAVYACPPAATVQTRYCNPEVEEQLEIARTADGDERVAAQIAAQELIWEDAGAIWLYTPDLNIGAAEGLEGFIPRFDTFTFFWDGVTLTQ